MLHIYSGILLSLKRNKFESVELRWMHLEPVTQEEISQKKKNKCCVLMHIYSESRKMVLKSILRDRNRDADIEINIIFLEVAFHFLLEGKAGFPPMPKKGITRKMFFNRHV